MTTTHNKRQSDACSETSRSEPSSSVSDRASCALRVAVRVRPIAPASGASTLTCTEQQVTVGGADYCFDRVFDACASQACVYDELNVKQLVEAAFAGVSSSVLAYGQTGAGKTHTMLGDACSVEQPFDEPRCAVDSGVIPRALVDLFEMAEQQLGSGALQTVSVRLTCVEVYCDKLRDLLALNAVDEVAAAVRLPPSPSTRLFSPPASGRPSLGGSRRASMGGGRELGGSEIMLREGRGGMIAIEGANTFEIGSARDALRCVRAAAAARTTGSTAMNLQSSRSHAVFTLRVETTAPDGSSAGIVRKSACELVFVDLAGSEGSKKSGAEGDRQREAIHINLGLHHLNNVIHELATQQRGSRSSGVHVNYRNCKLTRLLQNSLGGTARTCIIACVSPRSADVTETTDTLKYAERARQIRTRPVANVSAALVDPARQEGLIAELSALVKERESELASARAALAEQLSEHEAALQQERDASTDERALLDVDMRAQLDTQRIELDADKARALQAAAEAHAGELEVARASHVSELETSRALLASELDVERTFRALLASELDAERTSRALLDVNMRAQLDTQRIELDADKAHALQATAEAHASVLEVARASHVREIEAARELHASELEATCASHVSELEASRALLASELEVARTSHATELEASRATHASELEAARASHGSELDAARASYASELEAARTSHGSELEAARASHATELEASRATHASELEVVRASHGSELEAARTSHAAELEASRATHASELEVARASYASELEAVCTLHARELDDVHTNYTAALVARDGTSRQQGLLELNRVLNLLGDVLDTPADENEALSPLIDAGDVQSRFTPARFDSLASSALSFEFSQLAPELEPMSKPYLVVSVLGDKTLNSFQADAVTKAPPCAVLVCSANPVNLFTTTTTLFNASALAGDLLSP